MLIAQNGSVVLSNQVHICHAQTFPIREANCIFNQIHVLPRVDTQQRQNLFNFLRLFIAA